MERKLASIRRIKDVRPIPNADNIVCAVVDGWELVTQKSNNFQPGDLVVYFEIDSLLPINEEFAFLEKYRVSAKHSVNGEGYRLRTIKLRGQVSQGLILPLTNKFVYGACLGSNDWYEGQDLTELLGVKKYEKPIPAQLAGLIKGNFPSFIPKTDQERIQNCFEKVKNEWQNHEFEVTLKLDGASFTAYIRDGVFGVCSRNLDLKFSEENAYWQAAVKYNLERKLSEYGKDIAIQGELMGPGIQGNREQLSGLRLFVFDIYDINRQTYLTTLERYDVVTQLELEHVPGVDFTRFEGFDDVKDFLEYADGWNSLNHPVAEGVVCKSTSDPHVSFKVISNKFLLAES